MKKRVTIVDVAKEAGVSPSTVSRVLNSRSGDVPISDTTQKKVEKTARRLGYQASVFASALRTDRTDVIGAVIRDIRDPFLSLLVQEIQEVCYQAKKDLLIGHAKYDIQRAERILRLMRTRLFDAVVLLGDMPGDSFVIDELIESGTPFVTIARGTNAVAPSVNVDEQAGTNIALEYLLELGHHRIACIASRALAGVGERVEQYNKFVKKHDLPNYPEYVRTTEINHANIYQALKEIFNAPEAPTAIFCALDRVAVTAIDACRSMGLDVPNDVSIIGFDNIDDSAFTFPALTTIQQPTALMAKTAVDLLIEYIEADEEARVEIKSQRHILMPSLIVRNSCRRID
ncbi:MAG: LacI family DNA-binding transcriptional regulator [Phototrophicaceae bacterium]